MLQLSFFGRLFSHVVVTVIIMSYVIVSLISFNLLLNDNVMLIILLPNHHACSIYYF